MIERDTVIANQFRDRLVSGPYVKPTERDPVHAERLNTIGSLDTPGFVVDEKRVLYGGLLIGSWPGRDTQVVPWLLSAEGLPKAKRNVRLGHTYVARNFLQSPITEGFIPAQCDSHLCTNGTNMIGMYVYPSRVEGDYVGFVNDDYARRTTIGALEGISSITEEHPNFGIFLERPVPLLIMNGVQKSLRRDTTIPV